MKKKVDEYSGECVVHDVKLRVDVPCPACLLQKKCDHNEMLLRDIVGILRRNLGVNVKIAKISQILSGTTK